MQSQQKLPCNSGHAPEFCSRVPAMEPRVAVNLQGAANGLLYIVGPDPHELRGDAHCHRSFLGNRLRKMNTVPYKGNCALYDTRRRISRDPSSASMYSKKANYINEMIYRHRGVECI